MKVSKLTEFRRHYSSFLLLGPRLEESLSVMNIPRKRRTDLAVRLCGKLESIFIFNYFALFWCKSLVPRAIAVTYRHNVICGFFSASYHYQFKKISLLTTMIRSIWELLKLGMFWLNVWGIFRPVTLSWNLYAGLVSLGLLWATRPLFYGFVLDLSEESSTGSFVQVLVLEDCLLFKYYVVHFE